MKPTVCPTHGCSPAVVWLGLSGLFGVGGCHAHTTEGPPVEPTLATACAKYLSCRVDSGVQVVLRGVSDCLVQNSTHPAFLATGLFASTPVDCIDAAGDCMAVRRCIDGGLATGCAGIDPGRSQCRGNFLVTCAFGQATADDCSTAGFFRDPGGTCLVGSDGVAACGFGRCDPGAPPAACDGGTQVSCAHGIEQRFSCAGIGATCAAGSDGAMCVGPGALCTDYRCSGDDLIACVGGHELSISCKDRPLPGTCISNATTTDCVPAPGPGCDPASYTDHCSATRITYCDGEERTVDCADLGFQACGPVGDVAAACH
jgi:hypothetical protein